MLDGGTGTPNNPMPTEPEADFNSKQKAPSYSNKQSHTPSLKKD
jgi:hypothetical protein